MGRVVRSGGGAKRLIAAMKGLDGIVGKVGYFETAKYKDGTPVALVATVHEFGAKDIPARPTMRPTIMEHEQDWSKKFGQAAKGVAKGMITAEKAMNLVCDQAAGDVRKTISDLQSPPLKESTIKARQRKYADKKTRGNLAKPLVDTALMVNSVTYEVSKKQ